MKIMAVDDEEIALYVLIKVIREVLPEADIVQFEDSEAAFSYLEQQTVDIAFLDIEMDGYSGLELAEKCKQLCPTVNIIFVTGYSEYSMDALKLHVSGYLMKPVRAEELRTELQNLRHPLPAGKRVRIHTFGNFEVFVDDVPLKVPRQKCRECLAYLVDRKGASVTLAELSAVLWEDKPYDRNVQKNTSRVLSDLIKALQQAGVQDILHRTPSHAAIDTARVDCDYFSTLGGDTAWMKSFAGEYMSNYSWAEFTLGQLIERKK